MRFGVVLGENINTLSWSWFCVCNKIVGYVVYLQTSNINGYLPICLEISKVHGNGMAILGSLVNCTVFTNKYTFGEMKLRLGL